MAKLRVLLLLVLITGVSAPASDGQAQWPQRPGFMLDAPYGGPSSNSLRGGSTLFRPHGDLLTPRMTPDRQLLPWDSLDTQTHLRIRREASQMFG